MHFLGFKIKTRHFVWEHQKVQQTLLNATNKNFFLQFANAESDGKAGLLNFVSVIDRF